MKQNRPTANENCQPNGLARANSANSGAVSQLVCLLGLPFLRKLTDDEAAELAQFLHAALREMRETAYSEGMRDAEEYNSDATYLASLTCQTEH